MNKVIAIDFDETITDHTPYPYTGNIRPEARKYIKQLYDKGYSLVLWTSRKGIDYSSAVERLRTEHLYEYFDFNLLESLQSDGGKIDADFYIDDKAIPGEINWEEIYNYIVNNI